MSGFVERCGVANPDDGSLCQLAKGHEGLHQSATPPPIGFAPPARAYPPNPPAAPKQMGCFGIGCLSIIAVVILLAIIGSCSSRYSDSSSGAVSSSDQPASRNSAWSHKAVNSAPQAARIVGGFSSDDWNRYGKGIAHIANQRQKLGSFSIAQVVDQEKAREDARAEALREQKAAEEAHMFHGSPDCLVLDRRTLHNESGDYVWYVAGKVKNTCDRDFSYVQVEVGFYDDSGNLRNSGLANVNNLDSGDTWSFRALATEDGGTWRIKGLTGF